MLPLANFSWPANLPSAQRSCCFHGKKWKVLQRDVGHVTQLMMLGQFSFLNSWLQIKKQHTHTQFCTMLLLDFFFLLVLISYWGCWCQKCLPTFCEWLLVLFGSGPVLRKLGPGPHIVNTEETYHLTADFQHQAVAFVLSLTVDPELHFVLWVWSRIRLLEVEKKPTPFIILFGKTEPCPRRSSAYRDIFSFVCLFDFSEWADNGSARHRLLFVRAVGFAHVFSRDVRSEGRLPLELQVSLPQFKKLRRCSPLINSRTPARILWLATPLLFTIPLTSVWL